MLNGHGDDLHLVKGQIEHNFSSNVYYEGCPPELLNFLAQQINTSIKSYPSPAAEELSNCGAHKYKMSSSQFLFTNGAIEAFYLIAQLFRKKQATIVGPTFSEYEDACEIHQVNYKIVVQEELKNHLHDLVFICNPNNPSGSIFSCIELEALMKKNPTTTFVIDEAYIEFTNKTTSVISLVNKYTNLIVIRSLTKTFTIPGLRLGYVVSCSEMITNLLAIRIPWSVNSLAITAGKFIFQHYEKLLFDVSTLLKEREVFQSEISKIDWLEVQETNTSYFLVKLLKKTAKELKEYLIQHKILIRDATNFTKLEGEYIRLAVQSPQSNQQLIHHLKSWI